MSLSPSMGPEPFVLCNPEHCRISHTVVSSGEGGPRASWCNFQYWLGGGASLSPTHGHRLATQSRTPTSARASSRAQLALVCGRRHSWSVAEHSCCSYESPTLATPTVLCRRLWTGSRTAARTLARARELACVWTRSSRSGPAPMQPVEATLAGGAWRWPRWAGPSASPSDGRSTGLVRSA